MAAANPDVGTLLNTFVAELGRETRLLQQLVTLRSGPADVDARLRMAPMLSEVDAALSRLESSVEALHSVHAARAVTIGTDAARAAHHARTIDARIALIREHLPAELLHSLARKEAEAPLPYERGTEDAEDALYEECAGEVPVSDGPCSPPREEAQNVPADVGAANPSVKHSSAMQRAIAAGCESSSTARGAKSRNPMEVENIAPSNAAPPLSSSFDRNLDKSLPYVENVTEEELAAAPQYVRGRLTVERVAKVVACLNKVLQSKYALLARPPRTLETDEVTRCQDIRAIEADCTELLGRPFFTDADIKLEEGVSFDSNTKAAINVLRHISTLKEVRGKKKVRIFILANA